MIIVVVHGSVGDDGDGSSHGGGGSSNGSTDWVWFPITVQ